MSDHAKHLVQWRAVTQGYRLYCLHCGSYLNYETQAPNRMGGQPYERATIETKPLTVTLEVQSMKHKQTRRI